MDANAPPKDVNRASSDPLMESSMALLDQNKHVEDASRNSSQGVPLDDQLSIDSGNVPVVENRLSSGFIPIRARISDDADEDYEGDIEEEGSYTSMESYESLSEPVDSTGDTIIANPVGVLAQPWSASRAADNAQEDALMQLNQLSTGFASLDTSLLQNTDQEGFINRVANIAKANSVSPDDDAIQNILSALLPMVGRGFTKSLSAGGKDINAEGDFSRVIPVAKPTVEDDDDTDELNADNQEIGQAYHDYGSSDSDQLQYNRLGSARGLRVRCSDEETKEQGEDSILFPATTARVPFSYLASGQKDVTPGESDFCGEAPHLLSSNNADGKLEGQENSPRKNSELASRVEEEDLDINNSARDSLAVVAHSDSASNDSVHALPTRRSLFQGDQGGGQGNLEFSPEELPHMLDENWQAEVNEESPEFEPREASGNNSITNLPVHSSVGDLPMIAQAPSSDEDANTKIDEFQDDKISGSTEQANPLPKNMDKNSITAAIGERNLETNLNDNGQEKRECTEEGYVGPEIDDKRKPNDLIDHDLRIDESLSSISSVDPASDMPSLGGAGHSLAAQPLGLGRFTPLLEHAPRSVQRRLGESTASSSMEREVIGANGELSGGSQGVNEKLQTIRIKFLRLAHRLGQPPHNAVISQVLYRLGLAEQIREGQGTGRPGAFSLERAGVLAEEQEAAGHDDLDFVCTIMLLGKSGVGKSATINSLFDEIKAGTDAYSPATKKVHIVTGMVHGIKLKIIDTPGLLNSFTDQRHNRRILSSIKRFIKKSPPDIVLYFDRLDMQSRDYGDLSLLQTITDTFGAAVWFNAIVALTHAASAPPDDRNGMPINYDRFVDQRSHIVQQMIRQAAGDMRLMNPVALIENHSACRTNRAGQKVLPNGHVWKAQLLLLCFASKILAEANALLKLQDKNPGKVSGIRGRGPPLPYLLSSLLQSRAKVRMPDDQGGGDEDSDNYSDENEFDSDVEEEDYDDLPPFRRLTKEELQLLDRDQQKIYVEELEYRERLFFKKQLLEERKRRKEKTRRAQLPKDVFETAENQAEEESSPAAVPVPMPDMALPPSFSSDNPTYRYRYLDSPNQWLVRPVLETHGWDHDCGYDGLNVEKLFAISQRIPVSISGQFTKDKKEANLQMECAALLQNGDGKSTRAGLDLQTIGKDLACTVSSETMFNNLRRNKTSCGLAVTMLGDMVATGVKIEDRLQMGKRFKVTINTGALTGKGDVAYGGSMEALLRATDYPIDRSCSSVGLSIMNWHGDLAIGANVLLQIQVGKNLYIGRANLNNRGAGQVSMRMSSSEQLHIAFVGLIPLLRAFVIGKILNIHGVSP